MNTSSGAMLRMVSLDGCCEIVVGGAPVVIGRHPLCDIRLSSMQVSRYHCCLTEVGGELVVRDLASSNGSWINGRRVTAGRLKPGDTLAIAQVVFRVEGNVELKDQPGQSSGQPGEG
jgi:pSer/pThr/pTyr-binding forkhead associated (FHA) protein